MLAANLTLVVSRPHLGGFAPSPDLAEESSSGGDDDDPDGSSSSSDDELTTSQ